METQATPEPGLATAAKRTGRKRPLYRSVTDALRRQLTDGEMGPGARMPPLRELANRFSVSTITVRQALRALEQEGRLHCIPGVGTFVRPSLPQQTSSQQITVAFATIEIEAAFTGDVVHSVEEACQERGYALQLFNTRGDEQLEARILARLAKSGANGAIILPACAEANFEAMVQLKMSGMPMVIIDRVVPGLKVDYVASDHAKGAYLATEYLLRHGHRRVLMVTQPRELMSSVEARVRGYEQALIDHGIEPLRAWKAIMEKEAIDRGGSQRRWLGGYEAVMPVLKSLKPPIAIFAHNAYSGWGVFEACREVGLNIPRDVSVVCFDDSEVTRALEPPMTAIAQRPHTLAHTALELLERSLNGAGPTEPQQVRIDVDLIERGSVASVS